MKYFAAVTLLWFSTSTASIAGNVCSAEVSNNDLVGTYTISLGPGSLTVVTPNGGERVHEVPVKTGTATIALYDNVPVLNTDDLAEGGVMEIALEFAKPSERTTDFLDDPAYLTMSAEDAAIVLGCESAFSIPQLIGAGTVTGNGVVVPNAVQLMVYAQDDGGISAVGVYDSTVVSEATGGHLVFHLRVSMDPT